MILAFKFTASQIQAKAGLATPIIVKIGKRVQEKKLVGWGRELMIDCGVCSRQKDFFDLEKSLCERSHGRVKPTRIPWIPNDAIDFPT